MVPPQRHRLRVGGRTKVELLELLAGAGVSLNAYARTLFDDPQFTTSTDSCEVEVVVRSLPELGLNRGGTFDEILDGAAAQGLQPCPARPSWTRRSDARGHQPLLLNANSTRRFRLRPSAVSFGAAGSDSPLPMAVTRSSWMPAATKYEATASARAWLRLRL